MQKHLWDVPVETGEISSQLKFPTSCMKILSGSLVIHCCLLTFCKCFNKMLVTGKSGP